MKKNVTQCIFDLIILASRRRLVRIWLCKLIGIYGKLKKSKFTNNEIAEISSINPRICNGEIKNRLNLLIPALSQKYFFGGTDTALQVFQSLSKYFEVVRIIVTDEFLIDIKPDQFYYNWPIVSLNEESPLVSHIVIAGKRLNKTIAIHSQDYFMATAWWTAKNAYALLCWQKETFHEIVHRRIIYFIQDYEPGFYSWSSRFILAKATYDHTERTIAIINSHWLCEYLHSQKHEFFKEYVFQPCLNLNLALKRSKIKYFTKKKILLIYGRPSTDRNAFYIILEALKIWVKKYDGASEWKIISAGESFKSINLGGSCQLRCVGKISLDDYEDLLSSSAIGISLMISPHPSYPPLEMAAFGVRVLTNNFSNKKLSDISSYLISMDNMEPENISRIIGSMAVAFDKLDGSNRVVYKSQIDWSGDFINPEKNSNTWIVDAATELLKSEGQTL